MLGDPKKARKPPSDSVDKPIEQTLVEVSSVFSHLNLILDL